MKPPADQQFDTRGAGTDVPIVGRPRYGVRWPLVLLVATALGMLSSALAWQATQSLGKQAPPFRTLVALNCSYWYLWALFTPAIVWISQHFRLERQGIARAVAVHLPSVVLFPLAHIAVMAGVQWWMAVVAGKAFPWWTEVRRNTLQDFDWEMMTYWAIAGLSHALVYYRESRERALRAAQLETKLVEAQMRTLQQQLQPHFLFNTLHAISALMHRDVDAADRTLIRLSDLLRMTLENLGAQQVTLKTELDFLTKYLEIEQTRFADRLSVQFDVQPDALDVLVPTLLVQPLVENAIKHGIAKKKGPGHIVVSARASHDKLCIEVRDDGVGLSDTALNALRKGIGVSTTRARLQHQYGADYRFEFHRLPQGLAVVVAVPWRTATPPVVEVEDAVEPRARGAHRRIGTMGASGVRA
jgi:signal transduction histidine kinase